MLAKHVSSSLIHLVGFFLEQILMEKAVNGMACRYHYLVMGLE